MPNVTQAFLSACKSIDKRGSGKTVLAADYKAVHAAMGDAAVLTMLSGATSIAPAAPSTPATPELYPPTIPIALPPTLAVGSVTFNWLASCDKHDGTNVATGLSIYTPTVGGVDQATIAAGAGTEILGVPTQYTIGSPSPAGTYTRVGVDFNLTCGGTAGLEGTADAAFGAGFAYTSHQAGTVQVTALTAPDAPAVPPAYLPDYGGAGRMYRNSTAAGSIFLCIYYAQNRTVFVKWRTVLNGPVYQAYAVSDGSLGLLRIHPNGDGTFSCYRQTSGQSWQLVHTTTTAEVTLASSGIAFDFCFSLTGQVVSASFREVAHRSATLITKTVSGSSPVTAELRATDVAGNVSAKSASVTATPLTAGTVKWNSAGKHGVEVDLIFSSHTVTTAKAQCDYIRSSAANFNRVRIIPVWRRLEPTQNNYDFSEIDAIIDYVSNVTTPGRFDKSIYVTVEPWFMRFGAWSNYGAIPQYIVDAGWVENYGASAGLGGTQADFRVTACRARWEALGQAFASHVIASSGLTYEADPRVEALILTETSNQHGPNDFIHIAQTWKGYLPTTNVCVFHNYLQGVTVGSGDASFKNTMVAAKCGLGAPDILPPGLPYEDTGSRAFRGSGVDADGNFGSIDSRGVVPYYTCREVKWGAATNAELIDYCQSQQATHVDWAIDDASDWTATKAAVDADPTLHSTYPTGY